MIGNMAQQTSSGTWAEAVITDLKSVRGGLAIFWTIVFGIVLLIVAPLEWHHDLEPTKQFFDNNPLLGGELIATYGTVAAQALLIGLPILLNAILSRYAGFLKLAAGGVLLIEALDAYTDWPAAAAAFNGWWSMPVFTDAPLSFLLWLALRLIWQVLCTDGFELICVAAAIGLVVSLFGIWRKVVK